MASVSLAPGQDFAGDFTIERELSEGGMGVVYVALQRSTGKRRALKVMQPQLISSKDPAQTQKNIARFQAEARAGAAIESEHVVEVVAAGLDPATGAPWLAMELLDGADLAAELERRGHLSPAELRALFEQLCHALGAAHRAGACHLDLKPENIFLARSRNARGGQTVKVLDFGIARMVSEHRRSVTVTTAVGSPFWMAPEQSRRGAKVGPYTDVWALGLIAFLALTGRHYWREANVPPDEVNVPAWLLEMFSGALPSASERASELGLAGIVPAGFDAWFARCVTRDVDARFPDASAAFAALDAALGAVAATAPAAEATATAPALPLARTRPSPLSPVAPTVAVGAPPALPLGAEPAKPSPRRAVSRGVWAGLAVAAALGITGLGVARWHIESLPPASPVQNRGALPRAPTCPEGMERISGGMFQTGAPRSAGRPVNDPPHVVSVDSFCVDRTEVTVGAFRAFWAATRGPQPTEGGDCNWGRSDRAEHPVNCVDWFQASAYCAWTGHAQGPRRLPTEAEWERAAEGDALREFPWGPDAPSATRVNACGPECASRLRGVSAMPGRGDDGWPSTAPVGSFPSGASPAGVLDMAGNVAEWTETLFEPYPGADPQVAVSGTQEGVRVVRGGSWQSGNADDLRVVDRGRATASTRDPGVGFRCVSALR